MPVSISPQGSSVLVKVPLPEPVGGKPQTPSAPAVPSTPPPQPKQPTKVFLLPH